MEIFTQYLEQIENEKHRARTKEVLDWVKTNFPDLAPRFAWNQPMFTDHGTFVIGFSIAKPHDYFTTVAPERNPVPLH